MNDLNEKVDTVEVDVDLVYQTVMAFLCREPVSGRDVWVPKSLIRDPEVNDLEDMVPDVVARLAGDQLPSITLTVPEWFAVREELI